MHKSNALATVHHENISEIVEVKVNGETEEKPHYLARQNGTNDLLHYYFKLLFHITVQHRCFTG